MMTSEAARAEAKLTSSLLGSGAKGGESSKSTGRGAPRLHLNDFLDNSSSSSGRAGAKDGDDDGGFIDINIVEIDAQADAKTMESMLESLDFKDLDLGAGAKADSKGGGGCVYEGGTTTRTICLR